SDVHRGADPEERRALAARGGDVDAAARRDAPGARGMRASRLDPRALVIGIASALLCATLDAAAIPVGKAPDAAAGVDFAAGARDARALLDALVAADTTNPPGNEARAVAIGKQ